MRVILHYNRRKLSAGGAVEFEVYFKRHDRIFVSSKISVDKKYFDTAAQMVKSSHPESALYNLQIQALRDRINEIGITL